MFKRNRKPELKYQAMFNEHHKIQVCLYDETSGLYLQTVGLFTSYEFNRWCRENKISQAMIVWGDSSRDSELVKNSRYGFSQA